MFYACEVLEAINVIHSKDVIFRDLKPANVMVGENGHIKIIDFGFARSLPKDHRAYTNCGTLGYSAPEVLKGQGHSYAADIWSYGIMLYELLTGTLPFDDAADPLRI